MLFIYLNSKKDRPLHIAFFNTGAYQEQISGYGGIKHCLIPSPKHILIDRDENGIISHREYRSATNKCRHAQNIRLFMRRFAGIEEEFTQLDASKVVVIPVPFDGTSTYGKGADQGPNAIFDAAENMELYDIETDSEVYRKGVFIAPEIKESFSPEVVAEQVESSVQAYLEKDKWVTMLGGEHSVTIGALRAFRKKYGDITVVQLDAHSDLRPEYHGSACNHACALHESSKLDNLIQVGIRSMDCVELPFLNKDSLFTSYDIRSNPFWKEDVVNLMGEKVLYHY